jgi:hypothetical protein
VITSTSANAVQLKVLEVLGGSESRTLIQVWDGTDFDCNGNVSMKAVLLGSIGDTILAIIPKIQNIENTWDVTGDYRMPYHLYYTPVVSVRSDTIYGLMNGLINNGPSSWHISKMAYSDFRNYWFHHQGDCTQLTSIRERLDLPEPAILVVDRRIYLAPRENTVYTVSVWSVEGSRSVEETVKGEIVLDMQVFPHGVYIITFTEYTGRQFRRKFVL